MKQYLLFYATYCGKCHTLRKRIFRLEEKNQLTYKIELHDVDLEKELVKEHFVDGVPTLLIIEDGVEINRLKGSIYKEELLELNE